MRILTFADPIVPFRWRSGLRTDAGVLDLLAIHDARPVAAWAPTPAEIERRGVEGLPVLEGLAAESAEVPSAMLDPRTLVLGPCVVAPQKIICVGLNYRRHAVEAKMAIPDSPILFSKFANTLAADGQTIMIPSVTEQADYEVELAVVIGRRLNSVASQDALAGVLGYAAANDLSARDLQFKTSQWLLGKSLDGFLPIGPDLVTTNEVPDPQALSLRTWCNGELRQDSSTADMIFPVAELVSYISAHMTLESGDVILTGTPEGVIAGRPDPVWLADGDRVTMEIEGLGRLENLFRSG